MKIVISLQLSMVRGGRPKNKKSLMKQYYLSEPVKKLIKLIEAMTN